MYSGKPLGESLVLMKLLVQLKDNKTISDRDKICLILNFLYTHTIYPCITDFGLVFYFVQACFFFEFSSYFFHVLTVLSSVFHRLFLRGTVNLMTVLLI